MGGNIMKKLRVLIPICPAAAVLLEALPWGAVLNFGQPDGEPFRETFSYFSLTPFGYANFWPLITAVLSCALLILSVIAAIRPSTRLLRASGNVSAVAALVSVGSWVMFGFDYFTLIGGGITLALVLHTVLTALCVKNP
jgi:hypothetical protein